MDKLKKRILITFGDSFTHGLQKEKDKCLEYSFGYELSKSIGMDEYLNFAEPSLGNETIWKEFLVRNPRETFKNHDVYVVFIASYFVRFTIPVNGGYNTLSYGSSNENIMKEWIISNEDKSVEILEKYNTDTLREILLTFNDWNWKWITLMKIVVYPGFEPERLAAILETADGRAEIVNCDTAEAALASISDADAFLGKITPELLAQSRNLKWVQAFTVSLEHYIFPELVSHPCQLTNMRGLFGDVIADQVMGYVLCFARNLHLYIRQQLEHRYEPLGGESARVNNAFGPGVVNNMDRATIFLPETTMLVVGFGAIGAEIARMAMAFGIHVRGLD